VREILRQYVFFIESFLEGSLPMDMSQHKLAFTTARIPGLKGDELRALEPAKHIVVICNHRFYQIPAVDANGTRLCSQVFERLLRQIWAEAHGRMPRVKHSIGLMTRFVFVVLLSCLFCTSKNNAQK
jgi:hypothetical protein